MTLRSIQRRASSLLALLGAGLVMSGAQQPLAGPRAWESDVSVQSLDVSALKRGGPITARVVVATGNDAARDVRLEMLLPVGVGLLRVSDLCRASPSPVSSLSARVSCTLGDMPVRALRELSITTSSASVADARLGFAVFVFSDTPDPVPTNNFAERGLP